ncbi:MAG: hypothetical protein JWP75_1836 [Frondihabitans sp.]|nr:hypothetical protein [Frondihabitans sp.]
MADESDGIGEAFDGHMRIALAAAMHMAQHIARLREELARTSQLRTEQQNRELQARFVSERGAARASLSLIERPGWWDRASIAEIADAYETTEAWAPLDRDIAGVGERMREELSNRYGVDVNNLRADPASTRDAIDRTEHARAEPTYRRAGSAQNYVEAAVLLSAAEQRDQLDRELQSDFEPHNQDDSELGCAVPQSRDNAALTYDSEARRGKFANDMSGEGVHADLRSVRLAVDRENATHPSAAVSAKPGKQSKARSRSRAAGLTRERGGMTR